MEVNIRRAKPSEHVWLTGISFAAKGYWDYSNEYFDIWKDELIISAAYIEDNTVFVAVADGVVVAYYSIVQVERDFYSGETKVTKGFWLEHMFVLPEHIGKGAGKAMYAHAMQFCRDNGIDALKIFADPNAAGFYEKQGAQYMKECPSSIAGRSVSLFVDRL